MGKSIVITSGKGGVGKSTTAASIAAGLAGAGHKTVLLDMDIGLRSLDLLLGVENNLIYDVSDAANGTCSIDQALFRIEKLNSLYLLSASQTTDASSLSPYEAEALIHELKKKFEYVLIDCPAGIGRGFRNACHAADSAVLVVTPDCVSLRSAERVLHLLKADGIRDISLVLNRVQRRNGVSVDECISRLDIPLLGFIPEDARVTKAATRGIPVLDTESDAGDAFERITRRILGETVRFKIPFESFAHKIKSRFGKEYACKD